VNEAGGRVTHFDGTDYSPYKHGLIASNGTIHEELMKWVNDEI